MAKQTKADSGRKPKHLTQAPLLKLTPEHEQQLIKAINGFSGTGTTLESALGAAVLGQHYGWRVLRILHSPSTYSKYEKILGVTFKELCPERGPLAPRSVGLSVADRIKSFWAVVMGREKVENKGDLEL